MDDLDGALIRGANGVLYSVSDSVAEPVPEMPRTAEAIVAAPTDHEISDHASARTPVDSGDGASARTHVDPGDAVSSRTHIEPAGA